MTRTALILALGLSMVFNVFVLVGFMRAREAASVATQGPGPQRSPDEVVQRVQRDLRLDETQARTFRELHTTHRAQMQVFDDSLAIVRQEMSEELGRDNPDASRLRTLVGQEADLIREKRLAAADLFGQFVDALKPEQRRNFARRLGLLGPGPGAPGPGAGGPGAGRGLDGGQAPADGRVTDSNAPNRPERRGDRRWPQPGPEVMRRFDVNKNGQLDPDEAQAARRELEARRREFLPGDRRGGAPQPAPGEPMLPDDRNNRRGAMVGPNGPGPGGPREVIEQFGPAVMVPMWRWFDADNNSELNDAELAALNEFMATHTPPQRPQRDPNQPPPHPLQPDDEPAPPPQE